MAAGLRDATNYDEIPYPSGPFRNSHPCHLATLAELFAAQPPSIAGCRVLELGCASGGNIIPMAQDLPESEFVGIDLSARQIADGLSWLADLKLNNLDLRHLSITEVDEGLGRFDFIICHGVYSWVPRDVQDKIMAIGRDLLTERGLMYVSYNTYPGWHMRGVVRDMMQYHVAPFEDPRQRIAQARKLLEFLAESTSSTSAAYRTLLKDEAELLNKYSDAYLFHEHLEDFNDPLYFHEFVERAETHELTYLGESEFASMLAANFDEPTARILQDAPLQRQEQYMDFLRARTFRSSVLCHAGCELNRTVSPQRLERLHLGLVKHLQFPEVEVASPDVAVIESGGRSLSTGSPLTKAALKVLAEEFPCLISVPELTQRAVKLAELEETAAGANLWEDLMTMYCKGMLRGAIDPPSFVASAGETPTTTPLARYQAARNNRVTNRLHETVALDDFGVWILPLLDGAHRRDDLAESMAKNIAEGTLKVKAKGEQLQNVDTATCRQIVDQFLGLLASKALLVA